MFNECAKNLMLDFSAGREIFDEEQGRVMSKAEVDDAIRSVCFEELGLSKKSSNKEIKRALKSDKANELFAIVEESIDVQVAYGLSENEFFNAYVEEKNMKDGDANEFWADDEVILTVSKIADGNHYMTTQRLGEGEAYHVETAYYGIKVGDNLRLFLIGRKSWSDFIEAAAKAYVNKVQTLISTQFATGTNLIPVPSVLTGTGTLSSSTKAQFDAIIEKVEAANETSAVIMGTKTALKNLNALTKVDWADPASSIKESVANTGIIGTYEGTPLMVIPQKYEDKTLTTPIVDNSKLYIMPAVDNKFIKFVDYGETELEIAEAGGTMDDMQTYELKRRFGVGTLMSKYYGIWTI